MLYRPPPQLTHISADCYFVCVQCDSKACAILLVFSVIARLVLFCTLMPLSSVIVLKFSARSVLSMFRYTSGYC